jgi:hypothetical protein
MEVAIMGPRHPARLEADGFASRDTNGGRFTETLRHVIRRVGQATGVALVLAVVPAGPAHAQNIGSGDGFLFRPPAGTVAIRGGFEVARAGSEVFRFVTDELTVNRRDFSAPSFVFEVTHKVSPRVDAVFGVATSRSSTQSEYRHFLDNDDLPIEQTTAFQRVPLTASLKMYLGNPGRAIGRFAWIPKRYAPYVGAGGGAMWYRLRQEGDFIDFATLKVFPDTFDSDGWAPTVHAFAGTEVSLSARFAVSVEGRYQWAHASLNARDFSGFDPIDLSGFAVTSGFTIRY